jgi:hypothetical protein
MLILLRSHLPLERSAREWRPPVQACWPECIKVSQPRATPLNQGMQSGVAHVHICLVLLTPLVMLAHAPLTHRSSLWCSVKAKNVLVAVGGTPTKLSIPGAVGDLRCMDASSCGSGQYGFLCLTLSRKVFLL